MSFTDYSIPEGSHAIFGASKSSWLNDMDDDQIIKRYINSFATTIGTSTHKFAQHCINKKIRLSKNDKKLLLYHLLTDPEANIPKAVIDLDYLFPNVRNYVNDAITMNMETEKLVIYSDLSYGTADAISCINNYLRIHDLKTGRSPVHIDQLMIYAAYFCLDQNIRPKDLKGIELRIYQNSEIIFHNPEPADIEAIMNKSIYTNRVINKFRSEA